MSGADDLAQLIMRDRSNGPAIFDAYISDCQVTSTAGKWSVQGVSIRPQGSRDSIPAGWSASWEAEVVERQGRGLVGLLVEVHSVNGRPRVAYTVRG